MRPRVNVEKHIVQRSLFSVASGAVDVFFAANAKQAPVAATPQDVREGSVITAIYVEMWGVSSDSVVGSTIVTLEKLMGGMTAPAAGNMAALDSYTNKKNILFTQMGLIGDNNTYPMPLIKGWFKIPKGKQRFGIDDRLTLTIFAQSNPITCCGFYIFKEQF